MTTPHPDMLSNINTAFNIEWSIYHLIAIEHTNFLVETQAYNRVGTVIVKIL